MIKVQQQAAFRRISGLFLTLLFVSAFLARTTHHLFLHQNDDQYKQHEACQTDGKAQLHNPHFQTEGCLICGFIVAIPVLLDYTFVLPQRTLQDRTSVFSQALLLADCQHFATFLRGPPAIF